MPQSEIERVISDREPTADSHMTCSRGTIVYARVSSHGQKASGDLDRQVGELLASSGEASPLVLTDVGSGLNMRRRGLWQLIYAAERGLVNRVIVTHRDRLARFGTELIEHILCLHGVTVDVLHENRNITPQEEVVADLIALIASFSGRVYGLRGAILRATRDPLRQSSTS